MAYSEKLALRIEKIFNTEKVKFESKKMMGGLCYMVNNKMCLGVEKDRIMARVGPESYDEAMKIKGAKPMDFTGKVMRGFVFVNEKYLEKETDLKKWVALCLEYNPKAKISKKKKMASENTLDKFAKIILKRDKKVKSSSGKIMGTEGTVFNEEGVFKYALAKTKTGYTFHSLVIYACAPLHADLKSKIKSAKFQKGCVNFKSGEEFPLDIFDEHMKKASEFDFSGIINHYKSKKK
ncbi:MAG: TfoX/Sxy family protein [Ignavibacteria bacterium]|nr:TfoX/Sxy family protein [Ignavibacteria bacterium]